MKKLAVITGGSRGIGKAIAVDLASQGYNLALLAKNEEGLVQTRNFINQQYAVEVDLYPIDVTDLKQLIQVKDKVLQKHHKVNVLFNNAGILKIGTTDISPEDFNELIDVNLKGVFNLLHTFVPVFKKQREGHIFNTASMAGKVGTPNIGAYALTKFGVVGYNETLYKELLPYNVKVTALCPSATNTEMLKDFDMDPDSMILVDDIVKTVNFALSLSPNACLPEIQIRCKIIETESVS